MKTCDYCNLPLKSGEPQVSYQGNDFHDRCWEWMRRQRNIAQRKQAVGATFEVLHGGHGGKEKDEDTRP